jgi:hypothetical protein
VDALHAAQRNLAALRQQRWRQSSRVAAGGLTSHQQKMAVAIYVLAHHDKTVAAQYVHQTAQKQGRLPISRRGPALEECAEIAENLFLATDVEQLVSIELPDGKAQKHLQCLAHQWLACRSTALWVQQQNYSAGVAPSSSDMVNKYAEVAGVHVGTVASVERTGKRFCQKLRAGWNLRLGSLQVQDPIDDAVLHKKAWRVMRIALQTRLSLSVWRLCFCDRLNWQCRISLIAMWVGASFPRS